MRWRFNPLVQVSILTNLLGSFILSTSLIVIATNNWPATNLLRCQGKRFNEALEYRISVRGLLLMVHFLGYYGIKLPLQFHIQKHESACRSV